MEEVLCCWLGQGERKKDKQRNTDARRSLDKWKLFPMGAKELMIDVIAHSFIYAKARTSMEINQADIKS